MGFGVGMEGVIVTVVVEVLEVVEVVREKVAVIRHEQPEDTREAGCCDK